MDQPVRAPERNLQPLRPRKAKLDFRPDFCARCVLFMVRWRSRVPGWRIQTMGRLTTSELEGIMLIESAIPKVSDERMRKILERHLEDERRHAAVFGDRYEQLQRDAGVKVEPPPRPVPQSRKLTILELVAYLEVQEGRAIALLESYADLYEGDDATVTHIRRNIKDEKFHATWTHLQLERWIKEGLDEEVRLARAEARLTDRRAFWLQLFAFMRVLPSLLVRGYMPPLLTRQPSPM